MRFSIRFKIGNRFGAASKCSLRDLCVSVVDRYSLTETELATIVTLQINESFANGDMIVKRLA